ncbi:hypothetical protein VNI00_004680 [Paramarasmius palmivorus]|uniref:Uncharacterized protein n=1 Tax=Paramarasmius palmivorus TaxID=297713 RepID=A0AAW0DHP9_9AGAR
MPPTNDQHSLEKALQSLPLGSVAFAPFESYRNDYMWEKWFATGLPVSAACLCSHHGSTNTGELGKKFVQELARDLTGAVPALRHGHHFPVTSDVESSFSVLAFEAP